MVFNYRYLNMKYLCDLYLALQVARVVWTPSRTG